MTNTEPNAGEHSDEQGFFPPIPMVASIPTADVGLPPEGNNVRHAAYPVKQPEEELNEYLIEVRATKLTKCRTLLTALQGEKFSWAELLLAVSSLAIGASLGALSSDITYTSNASLWKFLFVALPLIGVATLTAYFFVRQTTSQNASSTAKAVLDELPDPAKSK
ncbi:MAG: hypothetical protein Q7T21_14065 [Gallionella sp.]|nr:hypothetical protein [Gallionella sp.]